jgi:hypothetical protein
MRNDLNRDPVFRDPPLEGPVTDRPVGRESGSGLIAAIFGVLVVLALIFYFKGYNPFVKRTASNTTIDNTATTEKVIPPAEPAKPAMKSTPTQPTQPQQ